MNLYKKAIFLFAVLFQIILLSAQEANTIFNWTQSQKQIHQLDSLIAQSKYYGLNPTNYHHLSTRELEDTANANLSIQNAAIHFFTELAYGNRLPSIGYYGVQFKLDKDAIIHQVIKSAQKGQLIELVNYYNNQSKEITSLLSELKKLQDSTPKPNKAIQIVNKVINDYRWLSAIQKNNKIILVNLPSAKLKVLENGKTVMNMKVIVGKPATPSGTLTALVNQLVINPYWNVPRSIMVREMLPSIKNDIAYLDRNHLEVRDLNYRKLNPYKINWYDIDTVHFPYYIRQSTGCDNTLGIIKLDFNNPYGIYLHDTPQKELFNLNKRFFSHGCMRMEKPIEMAKYLLKNNKAALDSIVFENCYKNPKPIILQMTEKVNVIVWYHLIDFDDRSRIIYYRNIYNKPLN